MDKKKIIVLSVLGLVLLVLIFIPGYLKMRSLVRQNSELEKQIEEIKQANTRLKEEQKKMNDPLYLEGVARKKLGVVREGEELYKVIPLQEGQ